MTRLRSNRVRFRNFSIGFAREDAISHERTDARGTKSISPTKSRLLFGLALLLVKDHYLPNRMLGNSDWRARNCRSKSRKRTKGELIHNLFGSIKDFFLEKSSHSLNLYAFLFTNVRLLFETINSSRRPLRCSTIETPIKRKEVLFDIEF